MCCTFSPYAGTMANVADTRRDAKDGDAAHDGDDPVEAERADERARARAARATTVRWVTSIVSIGSAVFAIVLALHIVFVVFSANDQNPLVTFVAGIADGLVVFFRDLFTPEDNRVGVLVNYGLAAIFWLVVGRLVIALLRRIR